MAMLVCAGALMQCSFGVAPSTLVVPPSNRVLSGPSSGTIMNNAPGAMIPNFGMCNASQNPAVQAATAAAGGTPTPSACVPSIPAPWAPGALTVTIGGVPALDVSSKLMCAYGGVIQIGAPGEFTVQVP